MKRRDALRELMKPALASEGPTADDPAEAARPAKTRAEPVRPGALRTMGLSLKQMSADADDARTLRAQIEGGQHVVDLDPALVDPSFVADRIPVEHDPGFDAFVQSVAEAGQQVPILVRPHPDVQGRYQAAYGHRRLRAAAALGRSVRAIIRPLTDTELVVAQGKENGERRDLSFIERATFATHLEQRGFDRPTIMAAIGVDKADLSRLIGLAKSVPVALVQAVGPAPKAGRPRWSQLADAIARRADATAAIEQTLRTAAFAAADSDRRFGLVLSALKAQDASAPLEAWSDGGGRALVRIERSATGTKLHVDERLAAGFGDFLIERLSALHDEFMRTGMPTARTRAETPHRPPRRGGADGAKRARSNQRSAENPGGADRD
ncbi:ParB family chromosome partitioning protein [Methylorubrum rhodinum]|uniref:ParB family chromosome partitioning protein n=2 Tax=Methylorubrum TaxID=2282523 RepID=A0A840ZMS2_9HYPH|nr:plasmid partitioning protein RepB [Methylorubrum rhodinum]MBB5758630.1 ParB family chromosome partitioning protein [Methylorubrum rhodinum]